MIWVAGIETSFRARFAGKLRNLSPLRAYKMSKKIDLLKQVTELIHKYRLDCFVTGGFAYDGVKGRISRYHYDLDLGYWESRRKAVFQAFQTEGFSISEESNYKAVAITETGSLCGPILLEAWRERVFQHIHNKDMVRVPEEFFAGRQSVTLNGVEFQILCNELVRSIVPFIDAPDSRAFVDSLTTTHSLSSPNTREPVVETMEVRVFEFKTGEANRWEGFAPVGFMAAW